MSLRLKSISPQAPLLVLLNNQDSTPKDLYVADGQIQKIEFIATAPDGKEYKITDRLLYTPCAGLCGFPPVIKRLNPGGVYEFKLVLENQLYVPSNGGYTNLFVLLQRGYSVRASYEMTGGYWSEVLESPWHGRVTSSELRAPKPVV